MQPSDTPYIGPAPFGTEDRQLFFGRERETGELASLVLAHPITLLVASSGAGKTSLVNAGLIPRLTGLDDGTPRCDVVPVVLFRQAAARETPESEFENCFLAFAAAAIGPEDAQLGSGGPDSLATALSNRPVATDRFGQQLPRVLIFDQFEELFTIHPHRWEDRGPFLNAVLEIADQDPMMRILISMREEYLARLEQLAGPRDSDDLRFRLHLERLDRDKALQAVTGPLPEGVEFDGGVAEALVDELRLERSGAANNGNSPAVFPGKYVEPVQLQVVCRALWSCLPEGTTTISDEVRQKCGSVDKALENFYASVVAEAVEADASVAQGMVRHWIEDDLISSRMSRNSVPLEDAEASGLTSAVLDRLVDEHLLRREDRFNFPWYELTHDRLIAPVLSSNAAWFAENPDPLYGVQQQTRQWLREERQSGYLLTGEPLVEASTFAKQHPELLTRDEHEFVRASDELQRDLQETERSRQRSRIIALACALAAGAMLLLSLYAFRLKQEADEQRAEAERQEQISLSQTVASQAMLAHARSEDELGALLARQAYRFDTEGDVVGDTGTALQATIGSPLFSTVVETPHAWISALAFSPVDSGLLATAGGANSDSTVYLWRKEGQSFAEEQRLTDPETDPGTDPDADRTHSSGATGVAFAADGESVVTSGGDGLVKRWETGTGALLERLPGPGGAVRAVATGVTEGGVPVIAAASCRTAREPALTLAADACPADSADVRVWRVEANGVSEPIDLEAEGMARLDAVEISGDGRWLAAAGCDVFTENSDSCEEGMVLLWSLGDLEAAPVRIFEQRGTVFALLFLDQEEAPDRLAWAGEDRILRVLTLADTGMEDSAVPLALTGHRDIVQSLAYSPVLNMIAGGDHDATVGIWNLRQVDPVVSVLGNATDWIRSLAFDRSGTVLASTDGGGGVRIWHLGTSAAPPAILTGHDDYVRSLAFAPVDGDPLLASAGEDGRVRVWSFGEDGVTEKVIPIRDDGLACKLSSVAWDRAAGRSRTGAEDGVARITTFGDGGTWSTVPVNAIPFQSGAVYALFAPDDSLVITGDVTGAVRIWNTSGGPPRGEDLPGETPKSPVNVLVMNSDGTMLAAGYRNGEVRLWSLADGGLTAEALDSLQQDTDVRAIAFGPNDLIAVGGAPGEGDTTLRIWNFRTGDLVAEVGGRQGEIRSLAFSPDGSQLASGSKDQTVMIWDPANWVALPVTIQVPEWIRALAFSPDGSMIVVPTSQGGIRTIEPDLDRLSERVCTTVSQNLSPGQWMSMISQDERVPYEMTCEGLAVPD